MVWRSLFLAAVAAVGLAGCRGPEAIKVAEAPKEAPKQEEPSFRDISMLAQTRRVPVIMYHDVRPVRDPESVWFDTTVDELEAHMRRIVEKGFTPISLAQLYGHLAKGEEIPEKSIVLTFDDSYQGYHDYALPILRQYGFPSAVFVHTAFVGKEGSHPKMSWDTLRTLAKDPLVTIGAHTVNHPEDMTLLSPEKQKFELEESKKELEEKLGIQVDFMTYPIGKNDATTRQLAREAGYKMSFTMDNMPAEHSPNILQIGRYIQTRLDTAIGDAERAASGAPAGIVHVNLADAPVTYEDVKVGRTELGIIRGGRPISVNSNTRKGVLEFVKENNGVAGINGGFFDMAAVQGTGNRMIGPFKSSDLPILLEDQYPERYERLRNRPLVFWGPKSFVIVPYQPEQMNSEKAIRAFMPDVSDVFLAGVWLIRDGVPQSEESQNLFGAKDIQDTRKRAFIGVDNMNRFVAGASLNVVSSARLARALAEAGIRDAVLLDSGFSTSLIYNGEIKAFGHSTKTRPSRPVPHAIVIQGTLGEATPTP